MKRLSIISVGIMIFGLTACAVSPEQQIAREKQRVKAEQDLQVRLARQCDAQTADLMFEKFNPPQNRTIEAEKAFEERYQQRLNEPLFKACYQLAWKNFLAEQELEEMRWQSRMDDFRRERFRRFCYLCY